MKSKFNKFWFLVIIGLSLISINWFLIQTVSHAAVNSYTADAYDLSQWQQSLTAAQAQNLKKEVKFVILRVQYGSAYQDSVFKTNEKLLRQYGVPYGAYSYSRYTDANDAKNEAKQLYQLAPYAQFYVNDAEEIDTNPKSNFVPATIAWANEMKQLTSKKVVLYSSQSMLDNQLSDARNAYTNIWLANYTQYEPNPAYRYDLWQFTDKYASQALNQNVDASVIPTDGKSLLTISTKKVTTNVKTQATKQTRYQKYKTKPVTKQVTKKTNTKVKKVIKSQPKNQYYNNEKIVFMEVTNPNGLYLYNYQTNKRIKHIDYGHYLLVNRFFKRDNTINALGANNQYYTSNKRYVTPITDEKILKELYKTIKK